MIDAVDFQLHAAIRGVTPENFECPDEDPGCPMTKQVLCAFAATGQQLKETSHSQTAKAILRGPALTADVSKRLGFMTCWDSTAGSIESRAKVCADKLDLDWSTISACTSGAMGDDLLKDAATYFVQRFPEHVSGIFGVPHVEIEGRVQSNTDYKPLLKALCQTGISVPACGQSTAPSVDSFGGFPVQNVV
mmetsp:Transcript_7953/g.17673  ORF Transcript_7953/g.17673 Transcript_7953/m.17673 type:complete len:191 (-) Transcript_7953:316-888(-)